MFSVLLLRSCLLMEHFFIIPNLKEEKVVIKNLATFATFSSCNFLFPDLLQHLIPATFNFFGKIFFFT